MSAARPRSRHDDRRADGAEFGGDPSDVARRAPALGRFPGVARPPDDRVVRGLRAGDVDLLDPGMLTQIRADIGTPAHDPQRIRVDQRLQRGLQDVVQVVVHGIELEQRDLVLDEDLLEAIERGDGGDIAGPEHQRDLSPAVRCRRIVGAGGIRCEVGSRDATLHPHVRGHARQQQAIPERLRKHLCRHLPVRELANGDMLQESFAAHRTERLRQRIAAAHQRVGARQPFLSDERGLVRDLLGSRRRQRPVFRHRHEARPDRGEDREALVDARLRPSVLGAGELRNRLVEFIVGLLVGFAQALDGHGVAPFRSGSPSRRRSSTYAGAPTIFARGGCEGYASIGGRFSSIDWRPRRDQRGL